MLARQSLFKEIRSENENIYSKHFPDKLYAHLASLGLISQKTLSFEPGNAVSVQLAIREEKINDSPIPNAVAISITNTLLAKTSNNPDFDLSNISANGMVCTEMIYYFINKNGLTSGFFDENGLDYPGAYNHEAMLWSNNFLCKQKTSAFVDDIINVIKKVVPEMTSPALETPRNCHIS
jgi:hypothetical protein